ncbi:LpqB family beta-propeller domain-containing protein [Brevibacterium ammoniilyticum]|uniref:LpqB family beta-propeller domain-containing protein n=1 Tax=Brevibacterium ammoniilyticum TaxID=1046555 RepID=A0ABP9TZJ9_9MICO
MSTPAHLRRLTVIVLAALSALVLSACSSIPTDSPVGHIEAQTSEPGADSARAPDGPKPGDSVGEIVRGFLAAGAGTANNFAVAKSFLTEAEAQEWNPLASVSVLSGDTEVDSLNYEVTSDQKTLTMSVPVVGIVDSSGIFSSATPSTRSNLEFSLRQENGEWRISSAPNGLVISPTTFRTIFLNYSLEFFTSDFSYLVPDSRWFLRSSSTPTAIINELLAGPAPYLAGAVVTAAPDGAKLNDSNVVTIESGVAHVSLGNLTPAPTDREKGLIRQQISSTLKAIPSISSVELTIGGQVVSESLQPKTDSSVQVDGPPVVIAGDRISRISGTTVARVENSPDLKGAEASDPAVSFDDSLYSYLSGGGRELKRLKADSSDPRTVLRGEGLVGPSIDRFNSIWTGERKNKGEIIAVGRDDEVYRVSADFLSGRELMDLEISRDGTRLAVLSRQGSEPARIDVVGIPRDRAGNPSASLADAPLEVGSYFSQIRDISWAGSTSLAALAQMPGETVQPYRVGVSGPPEQLGQLPGGGDRIAAGEDGRSILVTSSAGEIYSYNSNAWQKLIDVTAKDPAYPG